MLNELIFLGQIPGTNFQLTYYELQTFCSVLLMLALIRFEYSFILHHWRKQAGSNPIFGTAKFTLPAQLIGRIGLTPQASSVPDQLDLFSFQVPQDA